MSHIISDLSENQNPLPSAHIPVWDFMRPWECSLQALVRIWVGLDMRQKGPVGGQGDEPGELQEAWGNGPSTDPGLPGLQDASMAWQPTPV